MSTARAAALLPLLLAACVEERVQSALHPAGEGAVMIASLWWTMFALGAGTLVVVLALFAWAILRRRRAEDDRPRDADPILWLAVGGAGIPALVLAALLVATLHTMRRDALAEAAADDLVIEVVGKKWWWDVRYEHPEPQRRVHTANEIHVPVGRAVRLKLRSRDVIHSLWVPALHGKRDLIPGRTNEFWFRADEPGVFRGQCAEFCGIQHANMALLVVAHPPEEFAAWYEGQLTTPLPPADSLAARGRQVFLGRPCALCHTVRGTLALGSAGPELTHLATRRTLAAGTLPNTRGHLGGWIMDPQGVKPGNHMPPVALDSEELLALLAYLETLRPPPPASPTP